MKKAIANAVYNVNPLFEPINLHSGKNVIDIYLQNSYVSLFSAKQMNENCDIYLIVNFEVQKSTKIYLKMLE